MLINEEDMFENWRRSVQTLQIHLSKDALRPQWRSRAPFLFFAIKSALAAGVSWQIAALLLGNEGAALAPVSAIIIVQVTGWQTVRKGIERILGILIGVSLSVLVIHFVGVSIWTILLLIFGAQIVGMFVQKRGQYLATQIPISALLGLVVGTNQIGYPMLRLLGAVIGGLVGTLISLVLSSPIYITRAREAIAELTSQIATATPSLADAVAGQLGEVDSRATYTRMQALEQKVHATEQALSLGFDSARFNPWALRARSQLVDYSEVLLALNKITRQMRRLAYTVNEPFIPWRTVVHEQDWAQKQAQLLRTIGEILELTADYMLTSLTGRDVQENDDVRDANGGKKESIMATLDIAQQQLYASEELLLLPGSVDDLPVENGGHNRFSEGYRLSLRGAILTDLRRIMNELREVLTLLSPQRA